MKWMFPLIIILIMLTACTTLPLQPAPAAVPTNTPQTNLPNPASTYCEQQGNKLVIRTAADGSQSGVCILSDGSTCDEWAYYRKECGLTAQKSATPIPTVEPTQLAPTKTATIPAEYQGWWLYTHAVYKFSIMLPEDWIVDEVSANDPLMKGHLLNLHSKYAAGKENIRISFRRVGEEVLLWPTGAGQGEFVSQGTLDVAGQAAQRILLKCPAGEITAIYYHQGEGQPNITRGNLEFGLIFSVGSHCAAGASLNGKVQRLGELIIASLNMT